ENDTIGGGVGLAVDTPSAAGEGALVHTYLKFSITVPAGMQVSSATLTLWVRSSGTNGTQHNVFIYPVTDTTWIESGSTWSNRPGMEATSVGMLPTIADPDGTAFPVSANIAPSAFSGSGLYSFGLAYPAGEDH